jgi:hypothetical protein
LRWWPSIYGCELPSTWSCAENQLPCFPQAVGPTPATSILPTHVNLNWQKTTSAHQKSSWSDTVTVRYHCGGRPTEVNTCVLNSYMVYLLPKHSLGYYLHSALKHYYVHIYRVTIYMAQSPCSFLPLADSPCSRFFPCSLFYSPFTYLETLLAVTRSVHLGPRLLIN